MNWVINVPLVGVTLDLFTPEISIWMMSVFLIWGNVSEKSTSIGQQKASFLLKCVDADDVKVITLLGSDYHEGKYGVLDQFLIHLSLRYLMQICQNLQTTSVKRGCQFPPLIIQVQKWEYFEA